MIMNKKTKMIFICAVAAALIFGIFAGIAISKGTGDETGPKDSVEEAGTEADTGTETGTDTDTEGKNASDADTELKTGSDADAEGKSEAELAKAFVEALTAFIREIGLPTTFSEMKISSDTDFKAIADSTILTGGCAKRFTKEELLEVLLECR